MVKFMLEHASAAIFADPGVGKSSSVYAAFNFLLKAGVANRMLVIAPLRPCQLVWPAEQQKWRSFANLKVALLHGKHKDAALYSDANVCVMNPEGLDWLLDATKETYGAKGKTRVTADLKAFKKHGFDTLVLDESTLWKNTQSIRFKTLKAVRETFSRIWGLSGTPAPNGLIDLFGQALILDGGATFGPYITHYRNKYFVPSYDGFSWTLAKGAEERIYERIRPLALRLAADDYVDMPDLVENVVKFDLPPNSRKFYDAMEDDLIAKIGDQTVVAANAAAASIRLRQIANGGVYLDDAQPLTKTQIAHSGGRAWAVLHDAKTDLLAELVESLQGTPLLCFYDFHHDLDRILARFGKTTPNIGGGTSGKRVMEIEKAWNAGEISLLLGHPASIAHGVNLQHAGNHVAWYGLPWARDLLDQGNGRVRRQGSKHQTVFVHYLVARDTIDETIIHALRHKEKVQTALLRALNDRRRGRVEPSPKALKGKNRKD